MITSFTNFIENRANEGNAFTAALKKAQEDGAEEFELDGKTYKTKGDELKEEEKAPEAPEKKIGKLKTFEEFLKDKEVGDEVEAGVEKDKEKKEEKEKETEDTEMEVDAEQIADTDKDDADAEMADADAEEDQDEDA